MQSAKTVSLKELMKKLDTLAEGKGDKARAEALERIGPTLLTALEEFHTHLVATQTKVETLETTIKALDERIYGALFRMEEQFKGASSWIIKMLDAFPKPQEPIGFQSEPLKLRRVKK